VSEGVGLPRALLETLRAEVRAARWFAVLGKPLTTGERGDAWAYAAALDLGVLTIDQAHDWSETERLLKQPDGSTAWWDREETRRKVLLARAEAQYPERALWSVLTELTSEAGDLVHGKAAAAVARAGNAAAASVHVAAGAAAQAVYQLAVARLAGDAASLFESKFRLFAAGRWPLGVVGTRLILF
jgi:hypothetical protein